MQSIDDVFAELDELEAQKEKAKAQRKRENNAIASVLATKQGREVFSWILSLTHLDSSTYANDALTLAALSAQRDIGLEIKARLEEVEARAGRYPQPRCRADLHEGLRARAKRQAHPHLQGQNHQKQ